MWIYKLKTHADGSIDHQKARLVAKDFAQKYDLDNDETFALIAHMTTICTALAIAASSQWQLHHMNVKNILLKGDLQEEVYMTP